jgi:hypothetical protein
MSMGWQTEMGKIKARWTIKQMQERIGQPLALPKDAGELARLNEYAREIQEQGGTMPEYLKQTYAFMNNPLSLVDGYFQKKFPGQDKEFTKQLDEMLKEHLVTMDSKPGTSAVHTALMVSNGLTSAGTGAVMHQTLNIVGSMMHNGLMNTLDGLAQVADQHGRSAEAREHLEQLGKDIGILESTQLESLNKYAKSSEPEKILHVMNDVISGPINYVSKYTMGAAGFASNAHWKQSALEHPIETLATIKREFPVPGDAEKIMAEIKTLKPDEFSHETQAFFSSRKDDLHPSTSLARSWVGNKAKGTWAQLFLANKTRMVGIMGTSYNMTIHNIIEGYRTGNMTQVKDGYKNMAKIAVFLGLSGVAMGKFVDWITNKPEMKKQDATDYLTGIVSQSYGVSPYIANAMRDGQAKMALTGLVAPPLIGPVGDALSDIHGGVKLISSKDGEYKYRVFPGERTAAHIPVVGGFTHWLFPHPNEPKEKKE